MNIFYSKLPEDRLKLYQNLAVGDEVYWNDPDNGLASGTYKVIEIHDPPENRFPDTIVELVNEHGSYVEVYFQELS